MVSTFLGRRIPITIHPLSLALDSAVKIAALTLVIVVVNGTWLVFGALIAQVLHDPRKGRIANIVFAVLLVIAVALALI